MIETLKKIFEIMDQNNKRVQIEHSGSVPGNTKEKIRSGQSYLYKCSGMESEVFDIRFKGIISGSSLNEALRFSIKRYPYLNVKMVEMDGDFYIVRNDVTPVARKMKELPELGGISNDYHLIAITYWKDSIFVSFHHALCDGRGIKPFIETLIYYYCKIRYKSEASSAGIRLMDDVLLENETVEPFLNQYEYDNTKLFPEISKDGFAIPENLDKNANHSYRYELYIPENKFIEVCKENNSTPAIMVALLMNQAIAKMYPDYDKPINGNIATDMREALGVTNTFKNCVKTIVLPYDHNFDNFIFKEKIAKYRTLMSVQRNADYCKKEANKMLGLFDKLDSLPSLEEKQKIMSFFESMVLNTYVISYVGKFILNENNKYVDSIHLYNSGVIGLGINMISCCGKLILDFKQSFISNKYVDGFTDQLNEHGIPYDKTWVVKFETPKDVMIHRS